MPAAGRVCGHFPPSVSQVRRVPRLNLCLTLFYIYASTYMYAYPYTHPDMHPCTHPYTHTRLQVCLHMHIHVHMYIVNRVNAACNGSPAHLTAGSRLASTCRSQSILQTKGGFRMASRACKATAHYIASLSLVHPCPARLYIHFSFGVSTHTRTRTCTA